jgi:cytochrome c-type biogenesis protein CcmH/NrfF
MPKWKTSLFIALLAAVALAQEPATQPGGHEQPGGMSESGIMSPSVRRVGGRLACLCRTCKNTVGDCPMLECGYSSPTRRKIAELQAAGKTDDEVVSAMVAQNGTEALSVPPTQGFSIVAWTMPYVAVVIGLFAIWAFLRRLSAQRKLAPVSDPAILDRYHDRIEKDLEKFD